MKKKIFTVISVGMFVATAVTFTGCSSKRGTADVTPFVDDYDPNKTYDIEFFGWGDASEQAIYKSAIKNFELLYKNIHVNYQATDAGSYMTALTGKINTLPDVFYLPDTEFLQWADSGRLMNLLDAECQLEQKLSNVWDNAVNEYYYNPETFTLGKSDGAGMFALPKDQGPYTLGYNVAVMQRQITNNGLKDDADVNALLSGEPVTWDIFRSALKKLKVGMPTGDYPMTCYEMEAAVYSNNANFFDDTASLSKLSSPEFVAAIQFIADLCSDGIIPTSGGALAAGESDDTAMQTGHSLLTFVGPWDFANIWKNSTLNVDIIPVPYGPGADGEYGTADDGKSTTFIGSMGYCIPTQTKNRGTSGAALRLAKYLTFNEDAQRTFYSKGQCVPNLKSMADEYINDTEDVLTSEGHTDPEHRNIFIDIVDGFADEKDKIGGKTRALYYTYNSNWRTNLEAIINNSGLWKGSVTAKSVLDEYNSTFQKELDAMNKTLKRK